MTHRRIIIAALPAMAAAASLERLAFAQVNPPANALDESSPQASALGYRHDATKVDQAKYPKYAAGQTCANCALFQGKPNQDWAGCSIFPGKQVAAGGWCNAWAKRA